MKAFLAAIAFSAIAACVWYGVLDMQQKPAIAAFSTEGVRL